MSSKASVPVTVRTAGGRDLAAHDPHASDGGGSVNSSLSGPPSALTARQPASGTTRPSASIVACAAQALELGARHLVAGVVARAHERRRLDVLEAERERLDLHLGELVGVVVALERQVLERRSQVLADGQDVDVVRAQRLERLLQLVAASRRGRPSGLDFVWTG